ncbi:hypothetical protein T484DRAFT_1805747, partial [Baffinella frigidus]
VLGVAQGLVAFPRRTRVMTIPEARRRLEAAAAPPPDQGGAVERECIMCLSEPRTVRFGCGHSFLCGSCLGAFLEKKEKCPQCGAEVVRALLEQGAHVAQEDTFVAPPR